MPTPASGAITFTNIRDNFVGFTNADGFTYSSSNADLYNLNYYRGKKYRKSGIDTNFSSGAISFNNFYDSDGNCACLCACSTDSSCFTSDSVVLLHNNTLKKISEIQVGDKLATRIPELENTVVALHVVKLGSRKLYKINNRILTTGDHLFMTPLGWAAIEPNLYKAIRANVLKRVDNNIINFGIVDTTEIIELQQGSYINRGNKSGLELIESIEVIESSSELLLYCPVVDTVNEFIVDGIVADAPIIAFKGEN